MNIHRMYRPMHIIIKHGSDDQNKHNNNVIASCHLTPFVVGLMAPPSGLPRHVTYRLLVLQDYLKL